MKNLTEKQLADLLLTKAMVNSVGSIERWNSLNDVVDELFENGVIDREDYLHGIMELTQLGFVNSDIKEEEDIELSEAVGYDIIGLTSDGEAYIEQLNPTLKEKAMSFLKKFDETCEKISESGTVKLLSSLILPLSTLLV